MKQNIWAVYFSATGTTRAVTCHIAKEIAAKRNATYREFDFTLPEARESAKTFGKEDVVVFGTPVYAGRVPNVLLPYIKTVMGNGAKAVLVVCYGNRNYDDALMELALLLEEGGFQVGAAASFVGEHSFSRTLGAKRPDGEDFSLAADFGDAVAEKLTTETWRPVNIRGNNPLGGYYQPRDRKGVFIDIRKVKPKTKENCTGCGICAEVCPMGSIDREDVTAFTGICIKCGACIKKCPVEAKYYDDEGYLYHKEELELEYARRALPEIFL